MTSSLEKSWIMYLKSIIAMARITKPILQTEQVVLHHHSSNKVSLSLLNIATASL